MKNKVNLFTLRFIRNCKSFDDLKFAIRFVVDEMDNLTWGEFNAFQNVIRDQAQKVGVSVDEVNEYAINYQDRGIE